VVVGDAVKPRADDRIWHAPARELPVITMGLLAESWIDVAELEHAGALASQVESYHIRPAPRDALADWRPAPHTDLAQARMLAAGWGEKMLRSTIRQPPAPRIPVERPRPATFAEALAWAGKSRSSCL
jgi:hypothetical protein